MLCTNPKTRSSGIRQVCSNGAIRHYDSLLDNNDYFMEMDHH